MIFLLYLGLGIEIRFDISFLKLVVTAILPYGAAASDGRLHTGDNILEVSGYVSWYLHVCEQSQV